jgi:flagellar motor switch protein FliM
MSDKAEISTLRRKAAGGGRSGASLTAMTPLKALRSAAARAGDDALNCVVGLRELAEETVTLDELVEKLPDPALFVQLDGPGRMRGIAAITPQVLGAVIEAQTIGKVLKSAAADRKPTRTDATLIADFLDRTLAGFAALMAECPAPPPVGGFGFGGALVDARSGVMLLQDVKHLHFIAELDFGHGAKIGKLHLVLPAEHKVARSRTADKSEWHATMNSTVLGTTARLEAVLCRLKMPLCDIAVLKEGDVINLTMASLADVALVGADGNRLVTAALGRSGAMRAVRVALTVARKPSPAPKPAVPKIVTEPQPQPAPMQMADIEAK